MFYLDPKRRTSIKETEPQPVPAPPPPPEPPEEPPEAPEMGPESPEPVEEVEASPEAKKDPIAMAKDDMAEQVDCPPCRMDVGVGYMGGFCGFLTEMKADGDDELVAKIPDCDELGMAYQNGEITPAEFRDQILDVVKDTKFAAKFQMLIDVIEEEEPRVFKATLADLPERDEKGQPINTSLPT